MPRFTLALLTALLAGPAAASPDQADARPTPPKATAAKSDDDPDGLSGRHRRWIDKDVVWIISDVEREAFLDQPDEAMRDEFMRAFWEARDPTAGTRLNEFKIEHYKRIRNANLLFRDGGKGKGWKTPRGKLYVQLGPPKDRRQWPMESLLYPVELWFYQVDARLGFSSSFFSVIFYRPYGIPKWEIFKHGYDGPERLVGGMQVSGFSQTDQSALSDRRTALTYIKRHVDSDLYRAVLSPIPSDPIDENNFMSMPSHRQLISRLEGLHNRLPEDTSYIHKVGIPEVAVEYSFKNLGLAAHFHAGWDSAGDTVLHYAIEIPPESLTMQRYDRRTTGALEVLGKITTDDGSTPVVEIDERVELEFSKGEFKRLQSFPFAFQDVIPLLPGTYEANLVVRNLVSKEFGVVEGRFTVPARADRPLALGPILVAKMTKKATSGAVRPFQIGDTVYQPSADAYVSGRNELHAVLQVAYDTDRYRLGDEFTARWTITGDDGTDHAVGSDRVRVNPIYDGGVVTVVARLPMTVPGPGTYGLNVSLRATDGATVSTARAFLAGIRDADSPAWIWFPERSRTEGRSQLAYGEQHLAQGEEAAAIAAYMRAVAIPETEAPARARLGEIHLGQRRYAEAAAVLAPLAESRAASPYALLLAGLALSGAGDVAGATRTLEAAAEAAPKSVRILNALADELARAERSAEALTVFRRSLAVDPEQPKIRTRVAELEPAATAP